MRVPPGTWRGYEAGPKGLEIPVVGAPSLGEAPYSAKRVPQPDKTVGLGVWQWNSIWELVT